MLSAIFKFIIIILKSFFTSFFVLIFLYVIVYMVFYDKLRKYFDKAESNSLRKNFYSSFLIISLILFLIFSKDYWGNENIGSAFSKNNYNATYYVNVFPSEDYSKNYRLKADIKVISEEEIGKQIILEKVYWPNGGYITFYEHFDFSETLILNEKVYCRDDNNDEWYIELINQKVE